MSQKNLAAHLGKAKSWLCEVEQWRIWVKHDRPPLKTRIPTRLAVRIMLAGLYVAAYAATGHLTWSLVLSLLLTIAIRVWGTSTLDRQLIRRRCLPTRPSSASRQALRPAPCD